MLTPEMKREIVEYLLTYSKGLIEDCDAVGEVYADLSNADRRKMADEIDGFIEESKAKILRDLGMDPSPGGA